MAKNGQLVSGRLAVVIPGVFSGSSIEMKPILKAGGDVRTAMILRYGQPKFLTPVLFASKSAIQAFRATVSSELEACSIDNVFDNISGNALTLSFFLIVRTLSTFVALIFTRAGRASSRIYSTSNALPDAATCALFKLLHPRIDWVAVVHHVPENRSANYASWIHRILSMWSYAIALRLIARRADKIIAYHAPTIQLLRSLGVGGDRLEFNANGVDFTEIEAARTATPPRMRDSVVCVSRLSRLKGVPTLMQIWKNVSEQRPEARLTLIGADDALSRDEVTGLVGRLGISASVTLRGVVPRDELLKELLSCRIAVAPSFVEGWGLSVLEGLACGTPVVAWDLEAYRPFFPALITVPTANEAAFTSKILQYLDDDEEWLARSRASVEVSRDYSWGVVALREWEVLEGAGRSLA